QVPSVRKVPGIVAVAPVVIEIEQVAFAVVFENRAKDAAVSVIISELGVPEPRIQFSDSIEKIFIAPQATRGGCFRIRHGKPDQLGIGRIILLVRVHQFAVGFLVPPRVTEIRVHEEISLVHVTIHTLAGWNRAAELMDDGMPALGLRNCRVSGKTETLMSVPAPPTRISRRTIVRINDMAGRATARSVIAWMIVRAQKPKQRIVQSCFLKT